MDCCAVIYDHFDACFLSDVFTEHFMFCVDDIPPVLPTKKRGGSLKSSSLRSSPQPSPRHGTAGSDRTYMNAAGYNTMASVGRSKSAKQITQTAGASGMGVSNGGYLTMDHRHSNRSSSGSVSTPLQQVSESYGTADYANLTEQGVPLVGNVEGLKLSKAQSRSKRVLNRAKRPLPDLPPGQELTFTVADLPADFKGRHKPEILINGCVNYSACVSYHCATISNHKYQTLELSPTIHDCSCSS